MVSIFTYRDERKLFAVVGTIIVVAVIALVQLDSLRTGKASPLSTAVATVAVFAQQASSAVGGALRSAVTAASDVPRLSRQNSSLARENERLRAEAAILREALAAAPAARSLVALAAAVPRGIPCDVVGYDPENLAHVVTLDRGELAGIGRDDGVLGTGGVVGRVVAVTPLTSTVLLITDPGSKIPAVVQRGRWWGIATGTAAHVALQYVSQDAKLHVGDRIVTGQGRSFRAGFPIGRIVRVVHPPGSLYQTALLEPAVSFGRLGAVVVVPIAR